MLKLKAVLKDLRVAQIDVARHCGISAGAFAQIVNHDLWPKKPTQQEVKAKVLDFLAPHGVAKRTIFKVEPECANTPTPDHPSKSNQSQEDETMLLRKQILTPAAKKQFGLVRDPFGDLLSDADMWISKDIRYVREHMYDTAKFGGITAIVGESGAGKSSVRKALKDRVEKENLPILFAEPYMLASEDNDKKGKLVKCTHIAAAILRKIAPLEKPRLNTDALFNQLERALKAAKQSGQSVCLMIDEAHSLSIPALKHLKRLIEIEPDGGYGSLLSIILIGQPELLMKLDERNPDIRELVQRCSLVTLQPIAMNEVEEFIDFRLARVGKNAASIIDASGITALCNKMVGKGGASQLYPLAVGNFLTAAMNDAAKIGMPLIDADIINEVA